MPEYAFKLRNWKTGAQLSDLSQVLYEPEGIYRLCRPATWTGRVNLLEAAGVSPNPTSPLAPLSTSLQVTLDGATVFHGFSWRIHRKGDREKASALCTWVDPMKWWWYRVVRDATGNFSKPEFPTPRTGGRMIRDAITFSETFEGDPAGSPMALDLGSDTSIVDLSAKPVSFPMKIAELALLCGSSGRCDFWSAPKVAAGKMGDLVIFDRAGHTTSVSLSYGPGGNCDGGELIEDAESIATALWYFVGPKEDDEHWLYNVQKDDLGLPNPPQSAIAAAIASARSSYGYWQDMRFFDGADGDELDDPIVMAERRLVRRMWQLEQSLRLSPKQLMHLEPVPGVAMPWHDFFLGDKVSGSVPGLASGAAGQQRVYGFKVNPSDDGLHRVALMTSISDAP